VGDALRMKARATSRRGVSPASKPNRIYIKVDVPVPAPGSGVTIGGWAIDPEWKKTHPDEYNTALPFIEEEEAAPNLAQFMKRFRAPERTYVIERPPMEHPLPDDIILPDPVDAPTKEVLDEEEGSQDGG
jgi:hypothetical protein